MNQSAAENLDTQDIPSAAEYALIETLLFASGQPVTIEQLVRVSGLDEVLVHRLVEGLEQRYREDSCGFELTKIAGKLQLRTKPHFANYIRELKAELPRRLSNPALETLAVIAYRQPVVKSDIEKIRGVDVTPTLKTLLDRKLIKIMGHQASVGSPALYGTTDEFLQVFGLNTLSELPSLRDLNEIDRDPGEGDLAEEGSGESNSGDADSGDRETDLVPHYEAQESTD